MPDKATAETAVPTKAGDAVPTETEASKWSIIFQEISAVRATMIDDHKVQADRIATVISANGFLLGFIAVASPSIKSWATAPFVVSLSLLALALLAGVLALWPRYVIRGLLADRDAAKWVSTAADHQSVDQLLKWQTASIARGIDDSPIPSIMIFRRWCLRAQLVLLALGSLLLACAEAGSVL